MKNYIIIFIKMTLLVGCIVGMVYFTYRIFNYLSEENKNKKINNELIDIAVIENEKNTNTDNDTIQENNINSNEIPIKIDFTILKKKNKDIVGWIYLENSLINFPVVQSSDNEYYLRRLLDGTFNVAGSIFMDYRNNADLTDWNTIIYGHNMKNNTMFGTLSKYKEQSYYDEHKKMYYFTETKVYEIEILAGYTENANSEIYNISNNKNSEILKKARKLSTFASNVKEKDDDKFITLSTCSYEFDKARYILIGRLEEK